MRQQQQPIQESTNSNLTVPQSPHLVKQHSHPLLPSQMPSSSPIVVQRQHSQPGHRSTTRVTLHQPHRLTTHTSLDSYSPLPADNNSGSGLMGRGTPPSIRVVAAPMQSPPAVAGEQRQQSPHLLMATTGDDVNVLSLPSHLTQILGSKEDGSVEQVVSRSGAPPMLVVSGPSTGSLDYAPALRAKDELQRSISTPQASFLFSMNIVQSDSIVDLCSSSSSGADA